MRRKIGILSLAVSHLLFAAYSAPKRSKSTHVRNVRSPRACVVLIGSAPSTQADIIRRYNGFDATMVTTRNGIRTSSGGRADGAHVEGRGE